MKKILRELAILFAVVSTVVVVAELEAASGQEYLTYVGKVITIYGSTLSVEADNGNVMYFVVGRRTVYVPTRVPAIGERVEVEYYFRRGQNVAVQVKVVPSRTRT